MVREALQVTEVAIKLSALGIKNALALSLAYAKENPKVKGKTSLDRLLREGKELKIIPKVTTADRKKDPTRRQSDSSLLTRGKNPLDIDPRPSVRATIMKLKNAAQKAAQAQEKVQNITAKEER